MVRRFKFWGVGCYPHLAFNVFGSFVGTPNMAFQNYVMFYLKFYDSWKFHVSSSKWFKFLKIRGLNLGGPPSRVVTPQFFYVLLFVDTYTHPERCIHLTLTVPNFKILEGPFGGTLNFRRALDISDIFSNN